MWAHKCHSIHMDIRDQLAGQLSPAMWIPGMEFRQWGFFQAELSPKSWSVFLLLIFLCTFSVTPELGHDLACRRNFKKEY